jgi:hypothetical protein
MTRLLIFILVIGVLAFIIKLISENKTPTVQEERDLPYRKNKYFFSLAERRFYEVLKEVAAEQNLVLFAKVRLADIVYVPRDRHWQKYWNKIQSKHVDFLLCEPLEYEPMLGVELDDSSHGREDRIVRDMFMNAVFESVGLKLLRIPVRGEYIKEELTHDLQGCLTHDIN